MYYIIWGEVGKFFPYLLQIDVKSDSEVGKIEELERSKSWKVLIFPTTHMRLACV